MASSDQDPVSVPADRSGVRSSVLVSAVVGVVAFAAGAAMTYFIKDTPTQVVQQEVGMPVQQASHQWTPAQYQHSAFRHYFDPARPGLTGRPDYGYVFWDTNKGCRS